jgi:hypothetical protein
MSVSSIPTQSPLIGSDFGYETSQQIPSNCLCTCPGNETNIPRNDDDVVRLTFLTSTRGKFDSTNIPGTTIDAGH